MKQIEYLIKTLSPVTFAKRNNDNTLYNTEKYVSGAIFRGLLANKFIQDNKLGKLAHENKDFSNIFLSAKVRFLPAYPMGRTLKEGFEPYILPLSLMKSKDGKILKDIANGEKIEPGFKKMTGFAVKKANKICKVDIDTQIEFHMSRSSDTARILGSNRDGKVFNYEYIEPYQYFKGQIIVDDDLVDKISTYLRTLEQKNVYIGRSRNVQYGKCEFKILSVKDCLGENLKADKKYYLYAYTPYIPNKEWQRVDFVAENLCEIINKKLANRGVDTKALNLKKGNLIYATNEEYSGYVGVWQVRRERKMGISAGSMIEINLDKIDKESIAKLNAILFAGLGDRTQEGFGQFRLMQPLENLELEEVKKQIELNHTISDNVKKQAKTIIQNRILLEVKKQAVNDVDNKTKFIAKSRTTLNRIENLVNSNKSKMQIQNELNSFNKIAIDNLEQIFVNKEKLWEVLTEKNNVELPYANIDWKKMLGLNDKNLQLLQDMQKDLGNDVFIIDEDTLYKEYFLWFVRHAKKVISDKNKELK